MADSDPRKIRPLAQPADRQSYEAEEDPLVELARIVSEDSGFYGGKPSNPAPRRDQQIDRNAFSADLEAELLQELESSFSARPALAAPRRPSQPAQDLASDNADDLLRSIEAQLGEFERRGQPASRPAAIAKENVERVDASASVSAEQPSDILAESAPAEATAVAPVDAAAVPPAAPAARAFRPERKPERAGGLEETESPRPLPTRFAARLGRGTQAAAAGGAYVRPKDGSATPEHQSAPAREAAGHGQAEGGATTARAGGPGTPPPVGPIHGGGSAVGRRGAPNPGGEIRTALGGLEQALQGPAPAEPPANAEPALTRELEPSYPDPTFGGHWQDAAAESPTNEPPMADVSATPAPLTSRRYSRRALTMAVAILALVLLAGGLAAYWRAGDAAPGGPPPVIAADEGAVKVVAPAPPAAEAETIGEAVYNRVAGDPAPADEQVVDSAEEPREISRIVLPPTESEPNAALTREVGEAESPPATAEAGETPPAAPEPVGPRRVRTYVVRPDGTIVATSEAPAAAAATADQELAMPAAPIDPVRVQTTSVDETGRPQGRTEAEPAPVVIADSEVPAGGLATGNAAPPLELEEQAPADKAALASVDQTATADPAETAQPVSRDDHSAAIGPAETADPASVGEEAAAVPVETAAVSDGPAAEAPLQAEGHFVQLSSQREEAEAQQSFAALQRQYPDILGGMSLNVQRADLGDRGIYYRARVGPFPTRPEAINLCERLKAAGGPCIVTR